MPELTGPRAPIVPPTPPETDEEYQLGQWVRAATSRWAGRGLSPRERALLFAQLLRQLVAARADGRGLGVLLRQPPDVVADRLVRGRRRPRRRARAHPIR